MSQQLTDDYLRRYILARREEAKESKIDRMKFNRKNYEMYQLKHDFAHKQEGQSTEILSKQRMAVEQTKSFFQQALVDLGEWWRCVPKDGSDGVGMLIRPEEIQKLTNHMLKQAKYYSHVGNAVQSALLGSLAVTKIHGCMKSKPKFRTRKESRARNAKKIVETVEDKTWSLQFDIIRQENYYPDPTGSDLCRIEDSFIDLYILKQLAKDYDMYDLAVVNTLQPWSEDADLQSSKKALETGQNTAPGTTRPRVKVTELWGNIIDMQTGDILAENVVATLANDQHVIRKPTANPLWHQKSPINAAALIEVANSVWHTALMDAPTMHNAAIIELYNLILDSAMKAVHGINQLRVDALDDPSQVSDGIRFGKTLRVNSRLQPGAKVLEPVVTGEISPQALNVLNIIQQEFNSSALTNDLRQGVMPFRAVKATEVVEASNTITSVFQGIAKNVEVNLIQPELELAWQTTAQNLDLIDKEELVGLFGRERGEEISRMDPADVFAQTVNGVKFEVFGISLTLSKAADFRKLTTFLQTVASSELLLEAFLAKYDVSRLLGEIMTSLDIDKHKIELQAQEMPAGGQAENPLEQAAPGAAPNNMSQVPSAGAGSLVDIFGQPDVSNPQNFPGSPAIAGGA